MFTKNITQTMMVFHARPFLNKAPGESLTVSEAYDIIVVLSRREFRIGLGEDPGDDFLLAFLDVQDHRLG
jgi:hypothetical protein